MARHIQPISIATDGSAVVEHPRRSAGSENRHSMSPQPARDRIEPRRGSIGVRCRPNTVEGYFSIFKRGMRGVYQHCKEKHFAPLSCRV
jgi:hypothetical protein